MAIKEVLHNFVTTTSLKGIPKVINSPSIPQKILWAFGASFGMGFGIYILYELFNSYFTYDTVISIGEELKGSPFPDVTICNINPLPTDERLPGSNLTLNEYYTKLERLQKQQPLPKEYYDTLHYMQGYLMNIEEEFQEAPSFVTKCTWSSSDASELPCGFNCGYVNFRGSLNFHSCVTFHTNHTTRQIQHPVYGLAVILYLNDFTDTAVNHVDVNVHETFGHGVKVIVHPPNSLPLPWYEGVYLPPGQDSTVNIKTTERIWMPKPYGNCTKRRFLDDDESVLYTRRACGEMVRQKHFIKHCQCLDFKSIATKAQRKKYHYCGFLFENTNKTKEKLDCYSRTEDTVPTKMTDLCDIPCTEHRYDTSLHSVIWPHEAYHLRFHELFIKNTTLAPKFRVYEDIAATTKQDSSEGLERLRRTDLLRRNFMQVNVYAVEKELLRRVKDNPKVTVFSLIGTLGGACNLWMGITFLTAIELLDLLYQLCTHCQKKKVEEENHENGAHELLRNTNSDNDAIGQVTATDI